MTSIRRGSAGMPSTPVINADCNRARLHEPGQVHRGLLAGVDPPGLVGRAQHGDDKARRDEDQERAGRAEESAEVEPHAAGVDADADADGDEHPDDGPRCGEGGGLGGGEGGEQEYAGLEALFENRQEGHSGQRVGATLTQSLRGLRFELLLHAACVCVHPHDHPGDEHDRDRSDDRLHRLLPGLGERLFDGPETDADRDGQADRYGDADPHRQQALPVLAQERRDDSDDERCLEPLAKADHERGEHLVLRTIPRQAGHSD